MGPRRIVEAAAAVVAAAVVIGSAAPAATQESGPDLSGVTLELGDLPSGFRVVPDEDLVDVGGSARQVAESLEAVLEVARLEQYVVYASGPGDEVIEVVVLGPLVAREREGLSAELGDPERMVASLTPGFTMFVDQTDPEPFDTGGIGEASIGVRSSATVTSDLAVVTNVLGVQWTEATTGMVLGLRGDYVLLVATNHVGGGEPAVDLVAAARHVDAHLADALGIAGPGAFRPTDTFSPGIATHIPAPGDVSTDPPVVVANLVLAALAVLVLTVAGRMLDTTLAAHEGALERLLRPARAVGRWWAAADRSIEQRAGRRAELVRIAGVLAFYGALFSLLEDGWRPWTLSGLFLLVAMAVAFGLVGTTDDLVELRSARRWGLPAELAVRPALVLIAVSSVLFTKLAGLVPGLLIGTPEAFSVEEEVGDDDRWRLAKAGLVTTVAVAAGAWLLSAPLDAALDGGGGAVQDVLAALTTLCVLVFAVAVENLFVNLLAFPGSEGASLRAHNRAGWWVAMVAVTGLFFHTLVNPEGDLAEAMRATNVRVVLVTVVVFLACSLGIRWWLDRSDVTAAPTSALAWPPSAMPPPAVPPPAMPLPSPPAIDLRSLPPPTGAMSSGYCPSCELPVQVTSAGTCARCGQPVSAPASTASK